MPSVSRQLCCSCGGSEQHGTREESEIDRLIAAYPGCSTTKKKPAVQKSYCRDSNDHGRRLFLAVTGLALPGVVLAGFLMFPLLAVFWRLNDIQG